jgi:transcription elongation GreA/GreB family factor
MAVSIDIAEVRRRVRGAIDTARRQAQERRARSDQAARDYEAFLSERAVPVFQAFRSALVAEGMRFTVATPASTVRLVAEGSSEDYLEIVLDTTADPPIALGRVSRGRGRRLVTRERPVAEHASIGQLTDEDVLAFLVSEIGPFVER